MVWRSAYHRHLGGIWEVLEVFVIVGCDVC